MTKTKYVILLAFLGLALSSAVYLQAAEATAAATTGIKVASFDTVQRDISDSSPMGYEFEKLGNQNGVYIRKEVDVAIPGREGGLDLTFSRTYNSHYFTATTNVFYVPKDKLLMAESSTSATSFFSLDKSVEGIGFGWDVSSGASLQIEYNKIYEKDTESYWLWTYVDGHDDRTYSLAVIQLPNGTHIFRKCNADDHTSWTSNIKGDYSTFTEILESGQPDPQIGFSISRAVGYGLTLIDGTRYEFRNNTYAKFFQDYFQYVYPGGKDLDYWNDTTITGYFLSNEKLANGDTLNFKYDSSYENALIQSNYKNLPTPLSKHEQRSSETLWPMRLSTISDSYGRQISLEYRVVIPNYTDVSQINPVLAQQSAQISKVKYVGVNGDGQEIQYSYNPQNQLSCVAYPSGKKITYGYSYYNQGKGSDYKDKGYLLTSAIESTGLDTEVGYVWKDVSVAPSRNSSYTLKSVQFQSANLPSGLLYTYSYDTPISYSPYYITQDTWGFVHVNDIGFRETTRKEVDDSFCFQDVTITNPLGTVTNVYSEGLLTSSIDPLGWTSIQTWDFNNRRLSKTVLSKKGTSKYTSYNAYDSHGNPKEIEEGGTGISTTKRRYSYVWESSTDSNWRNYVVTHGPLNLVLSESKVGSDGTLVTTTYGYTSAFGANGMPSIFGPISKDTWYTTYYFLFGNLCQCVQRKLSESYGYYPTSLTGQPATLLKSKILPNGKEMDYAYVNNLYPASTTYADLGLSSSHGYNISLGLVTSQTGFNQSKNFNYYFDGRLKEVVYNPGQSNETKESYIYDISNRKTTVTDRVNNVTIATVDGLGRTIKTENFSAGSSTAYREESFTYTPGGKIETDTILKREPVSGTTSTRVTRYAYDNGNRVKSITNPEGSRTTIVYEDTQGLKTITDAKGNITKYYLDGDDRVIKITDAKNNDTLYQYDSFGNVSKMTDASGLVTDCVYDALNKVIQIKSPYVVTGFEYDDNGNLLKETKGGLPLNSRRYGVQYGNYDSLGNYGTRTTGTYGPLSGNLEETNTEQFFYNDATHKAKGLLWKTQSNGYTLEYNYDSDGHIVAMTHTFPNGTQIPLGYQYNAISQLLTHTTPWGTTVYAYDPQQHLDTVKFNNVVMAKYQYDIAQFGNPTQLALNNGAITIQSTYSNAPYTDWINAQTVKVGTTPVATLGYQYDAIGNRTSLTSSLSGQPGQTVQYGYDGLSELTQTNYPGMTFSYQYDKIGNRTAMQTPYGTGSYSAPEMGYSTRTIGVNYNGVTTKQKYSNITGSLQSRTESIGQTTQRDQAYTFNALDRLTTVTDTQSGATNTYGFQYDTQGHRLSMTKNNQVQTYYVWGQTHTPEAELDSTGTLTKLNLQTPSGEKLADSFGNPTSGGYWKFHANDPLGTPIAIINASSKVETQYSLTPFGDFKFKGSFSLSELDPMYKFNFQLNSQLSSGQSLGIQLPQIRLAPGFTAKAGSSLRLTATPVQTTTSADARNVVSFTGKSFEEGLGLYYFNARWYDPVMGRFISPDPKWPDSNKPLTLNPYIYCYNNPINLVDRDGRAPDYSRPYIDPGLGGGGLSRYQQVFNTIQSVPSVVYSGTGVVLGVSAYVANAEWMVPLTAVGIGVGSGSLLKSFLENGNSKKFYYDVGMTGVSFVKGAPGIGFGAISLLKDISPSQEYLSNLQINNTNINSFNEPISNLSGLPGGNMQIDSNEYIDNFDNYSNFDDWYNDYFGGDDF